ncbi:MAG: AzlC family ABC transporter permease [Geminicoccaceae bacterium]
MPPIRHDDGSRRQSWQEVAEGFRRILPVTLYVVPMGLAFGAAAVQQDLPGALAILMSAIVFAGAAQFAGLDLWAASPALVPLLLMTFAVNARHLLLGASLAPWLNKLPALRRYGTVSLLSDPNWALVTQTQEEAGCGADPARLANLLLGSGIALWVTWLIGTAAGVALGGDLGDLSRFGLDLLALVLFAAVLTGLWRSVKEDLVPWLAAAAVALVGSWVLPGGWHVLAGALAGGVVGVLRHGR